MSIKTNPRPLPLLLAALCIPCMANSQNDNNFSKNLTGYPIQDQAQLAQTTEIYTLPGNGSIQFLVTANSFREYVNIQLQCQNTPIHALTITASQPTAQIKKAFQCAGLHYTVSGTLNYAPNVIRTGKLYANPLIINNQAIYGVIASF